MKKLTLFTAALVFICASANAQITKGSLFFGGSLNAYSDVIEYTPNTNLENKQTNWSIRPQVGKAIAENKIAGVFLNFGGSKYVQTSAPNNSSETVSSLYGGGVFLRHYYPLNKRFFVFGDAGVGIGFGNEEGRNNNGTTNYIYRKGKNTEVSVALTPGISFAATKKLHLEAALSNLFSAFYKSTKITEYNSPNVVLRTSDRKTFNTNINANGFNNIAIGLRWILP